MKILLLNPPKLDQSRYGKEILIQTCPESGLSYLYSYLKNHNYNCKIYNFFFDSWDYIERILTKEDADIIGISCQTEGRYNAFKLLYLIRKIKKNTIVIFGGHHSTFMCDQLLQNFNIDYIVFGEGEKKLLNLIKAIEGRIPLESVGGIAYRKNGVIIKNIATEKDIITDLDSLPFPFSEEQLEIFRNYPTLKESLPFYIKDLSHLSYVYEKSKSISIITSRGCPLNCQFCSATSFWGKKVKFRSPEKVVDEIEFYYKKLGFKFFRFWDYTFTLIPKKSIKICKEIINRNLKINFTCQTKAEGITKELVYWLKNAGCVSVGIGVESGSKKILKNINKKLSLKSVIKTFSIFKKDNLPAFPFIMVGNPGETNETIRETINLIKIIKPNRIVISRTMLFPGTDLYKLAKEQGFICDDYWLTPKPQPYYTFENSIKTLKKWEFQIKNYDKKKYQLRIITLLYKLRVSLDLFYSKLIHDSDSNSSLARIYYMMCDKLIRTFQIK